jgi:folate-binding protein YgfZ
LGGVYPWTGRGWLEVAGRHRAAFLHSFCTQEIKKLAPGDIRETFFCQGNGKIVGHGFVVVEPERLLIATPREHVAPLLRHLDRFVIREDVRLADRSDMAAAALFCGAAGVGLRRAGGLLTVAGKRPAADGPSTGDGPKAAERVDEWVSLSAVLSAALSASIVVRKNPWQPNDDALWVEYAADAVVHEPLDRLRQIALAGLQRIAGVESPDSSSQDLATSDRARSVALWDEPTFDAWRIAVGAPLYGREISAEQLPQEVGRNAQAISFTKGCYLGQEPVARIDALGHVNWELVTFQLIPPPASSGGVDGLASSSPLAAGTTLSMDGKPVLRIATLLPWNDSDVPASAPETERTGTYAGLGYVRREARRAARSASDPLAEGVLSTPAGLVRIQPRLFHG